MFGLASFAIALPLVRVLVESPEFLIAHQLRPSAALGYFAAVILLVPALLAVASSFPGWHGSALRTAIVTVLACLAVAGIAQPIASWSLAFWVASIGGGIALAAAEARHRAVRSTFALLGVTSLLLGAWVVGPSRVGRYVRSGNVAAVAPAAIESDTPVVVIVLDEFSMVPTLDGDLAIDPVRFPNLAALAATSHWFRLASSVSPQTSASVPALLSGVEADPDRVPISSQYPTNIFRVLGDSYDIAAYEPITALCADACGDAPATSTEPDGTSLATLLGDSSVVLRHAIGSDAMRASLPSISQGWAGFDDASGAAGASGEDEGGYGTFFAQVDELQDLLASEGASARPALRVAHLIAPHLPWVAMPDGTVHSGAQPAGLSQEGGALAWGDAEADRRAGYQRYLLQLGALDRAIGQVRTTLEDEGRWDDALVAVTADHGVQFEPGTIRNVDAGGVEVTSVPLLIKEPGQTEGTVDDRAALTIDLVPTIVGLLGGPLPEGFDGIDLFAEEVPEERPDAFLAVPGQRVTPDQRLDALRRAVERRRSWIDPDGGWDAVYQAGVDEQLVGRELSSFPISLPAGTWARTSGETGRRIAATISGVPGARAVLVVCDGTVAGAAPVNTAGAALSVEAYASHERCVDPDAATLAVLEGGDAVHLLERSR